MNWYSVQFKLASVTPIDQKWVLKKHDAGWSKKNISKGLGVLPGVVDNILLKNRKIEPNIDSDKSSCKSGLVSDSEIIDKVKDLQKSLNKNQIAKRLGVSYQTVDRIMARHCDGGVAGLMKHIFYEFSKHYHTGIKGYLKKLPFKKREPFICGFIDKILKDNKDCDTVKKDICRKFGLGD